MKTHAPLASSMAFLIACIIALPNSLFAQPIHNSVVKNMQLHLAPLRLVELPLGAIKPAGWLKTQLVIMRNGSTGHLDETFSKLSNDNGWLGGNGDDWEETPYWLDGSLPLAYLLDDDSLKRKVSRYINWTIANQRPSGFFGPYSKQEREGKSTGLSPQNGGDWWPRMIMLKVLQQYYSATSDKRVIEFMTKYFKYQMKSLKECPLGNWTEWARARGSENLMSVYWLYRITKAPFLLELGELLYSQTYPWTALFGKRNWVMQSSAQQNGENWMNRHGVNVAMALKLPAVYYQASKSKTYLDSLNTGFDDLMLLHGLPSGMFSADEDLHGNLPSQGTELCAIVETMFSMENVIGITGNLKFADALERIAFNSLPTQTSDDFHDRQYFQVANQIVVKRGVSHFSLPFDLGMNNVFGPYSGYTCCTSNMHQGWTKFASHLWYATPDSGLAAIEYAPCKVIMQIKNVKVTIHEETNYPFNDAIQFTISSSGKTNCPLRFRIPAWCHEATLTLSDGKKYTGVGGKMIEVARTWQNNEHLVLKLPMQVRVINNARNSRSIERGPLIYALKVNSQIHWDSIQTKSDVYERYFELSPITDWNFGLIKKAVDNPMLNFTVHTNSSFPDFPWSETNAPVEIHGFGKRIPGWQLSTDNVADLPVTTREGIYQGKVEKESSSITLIPYGCTKLRVVAFPVVK